MKGGLLFLLRAYKWALSPLLPPACRYVPTCSEYAMEAVEQYGISRGITKSLMRVLRCHPLARGGYDPVQPGRQPIADENGSLTVGHNRHTY